MPSLTSNGVHVRAVYIARAVDTKYFACPMRNKFAIFNLPACAEASAGRQFANKISNPNSQAELRLNFDSCDFFAN